jgi:ferredoxin
MPKKIPIVDQKKCTGCGTCVALCGDVFEIKEDGKSHVVNPKGCDNCDCQAAIDSCPVQAINWKKR